MSACCLCFSKLISTRFSCCTDGVFISFVQNCPDDVEAAGAVLFALPKWAVYRGATYFWVPVWIASSVQEAAGYKGNTENYPSTAFLQLQPVLPQREADVAAEVAYFVTDVSVLL
jgi:hypothetical protein